MRSLLIVFIVLVGTSPALARTEATLTIMGPISTKKLKTVLRDAIVQDYLFTKSERKLMRNKFPLLTQSKRVVFRNQTEFVKAQREIQRWQLPVALEPRDLDLREASEPANQQTRNPLQWALSNNGSAQLVELAANKTNKIPGIENEDIRWIEPTEPAKRRVRLAVIDTGVDFDHPALKPVLYRNESECAALEKFLSCIEDTKDRPSCEAKWYDLNNPEVDLDKNGYPLDCQGWSITGGIGKTGIAGRPDFKPDESGHGTHVKGIIAAVAQPGVGIGGISKNIEILPIQVGASPAGPLRFSAFNYSPVEGQGLPPIRLSTRYVDELARAIIYAVLNHAEVINMSLVWPLSADTKLIRQVISDAQREGVSFVAAAGNDSTTAVACPCSYPGVICVGSHGPDGAFSHFSNYGSAVDVLASGLSIISTIPLDHTPGYFRQRGYDYLSGTSQASPIVAAVMGDLLARGYSATEIYARLLLGARPTKRALRPWTGSAPGSLEYLNEPGSTKTSLSGNLDVAAALKLAPQPLVLPSTKERAILNWDGKSERFQWRFFLKNYWKEFAANDFSLDVQVSDENQSSTRPIIDKVEMAPLQGLWPSGFEREVILTLKIVDALPELTRLPSHLAVELNIKTPTNARKVGLEAEVLMSLQAQGPIQNGHFIPIVNLPKDGLNIIPVVDNLDLKSERDYFLFECSESKWNMWISQQRPGPKMVVTDKVQLPGFDCTQSNYLFQITARLQKPGTQESQYLLVIYSNNSFQDSQRQQWFYIFSEQGKLLEHFVYNSELSYINTNVKWTWFKNKPRPVWFGPGFTPEQDRTEIEAWKKKTGAREREDYRLYYLDEEWRLGASALNQQDRVAQVLEPTVDQLEQGVVPILLARKLAGENQPTYFYQFSTAEFKDGKISKVKEVDSSYSLSGLLMDLQTRLDKIINTDFEPLIGNGTFWFKPSSLPRQNFIFLSHGEDSIQGKTLYPMQRTFDSLRWVRSVFLGSRISGAFAITNSELQYHNLKNEQVVKRSLERFSFYYDSLSVNLQYPILVEDRLLQLKLPALYLAETAGFSRSFKITLPHYSSQGSVDKLVVPARLRFKSPMGCVPMNTPIWGGKEAASYFDYDCRDKIMRVKLVY